jgi:hypothetical protein
MKMRSLHTVDKERGIALAVAIFALVVIGALVAGSFFFGMQERRVGRNSIRLQQAFAAAEEGANLQVANWDTRVLNYITIGDSVPFAGTVATSGGWYRGSVRRLNNALYLVRSEGFDRDSLSRQQVGLLVRLRPLEIKIKAALETQGDLTLGGSSEVDGHDTHPTGWACGAYSADLPGVRIKDSTLIATAGCSGLSCVDGSVKIEEDPAIDDSTLTTFGDVPWMDLTGLANKVIGPGTYKAEPTFAGAECNLNDQTNWGDPLNPAGPCGSYFPVIYATGDISVNGVQGQGILLVDGNLDVQGGFEFYGPVIVRGALSTQGTGGHFNGGVIAANVDLDQSSVLGDAMVTYSSCAVARAVNGAASGAKLKERSWVNLN